MSGDPFRKLVTRDIQMQGAGRRRDAAGLRPVERVAALAGAGGTASHAAVFALAPSSATTGRGRVPLAFGGGLRYHCATGGAR